MKFIGKGYIVQARPVESPGNTYDGPDIEITIRVLRHRSDCSFDVAKQLAVSMKLANIEIDDEVN